MKFSVMALGGAMAAYASGAYAQNTVPAPAAPAPAIAPAAPPVATGPAIQPVAQGGQAVLRAGTPVALRMSEGLTTEGKKLRVGHRFRLETAEPVFVNGQTVIPAGSPAMGEVTDVRNKGMWGKSGRINARVLYVTANGRQIRMSGQLDDKGTTGTAGVVASVALVPVVGFLVTGTSARIPVGGAVNGFIDEDVPLSFAEATATPMMVGAAPAAPTATPATAPAVATLVTVPAPAIAIDPARRRDQREDYIRLTERQGFTKDAARIAVEKKYGFPLEPASDAVVQGVRR